MREKETDWARGRGSVWLRRPAPGFKSWVWQSDSLCSLILKGLLC